MSLRLIAFALALASAAPALAQTSATSAIPDVGGGPGGGGRGGAMRACAADRQSYCADVERGGGRIMQCMKAHADKLSPACKDALTAMRAQRQGK